ncbi:hypothetical protein BG011_003946 [Mortierella polycephala]|uniref:Protein phosphatase inhibitor 2 n=1 Tax=Mortierella polycephala TaxID=41804 RepID=A0A9P6Q1F6_9FUNG|nr:hypothetical protein BG011_003946 [Mortierella polycephala]
MEPTRRHSPVLGSTEDQHPVKGILKKTIATQHQPDENAPRLKWDEQNLIITEAQKDSTMKIDEPKTPFVYYDHKLDKVMDPEEVFALDGPRKKQAALAHTPPVPSYFKGLQDEDDDEDDDEDRDQDPDEWQSSDEEEEEEHEAPSVYHDKFAKMRAKHYKMEEAIKLGQRLVDGDDDDNEDDDEDKDEDSKSKRTLGPVSTVPGSGSNTDMRKAKDNDEDSLDMEL